MRKTDIKEFMMLFCDLKVVLIIAIFTVLGVIYSETFLKTMYTSVTSLIVTTEKDNKQETNENINLIDIGINEEKILKYNEILKNEYVIQRVVSNLKIDDNSDNLSKCVSLKESENNNFIDIVAVYKNRKQSVEISNEISNIFINEISKTENDYSFKIEKRATAKDISVKNSKYGCIFTFICIGIGISFLYIIFSKRKVKKCKEKTPDVNINNELEEKLEYELEKELNIPVMCILPVFNQNNIRLKQNDNKSLLSNYYNRLIDNVDLMSTNKVMKTFLITSTVAEEGKSFVSYNLALKYIQKGKRVLLIDADFNSSTQSRIFGINNKLGFSDILVQKTEKFVASNLIKYFNKVGISNFAVISSGIKSVNYSDSDVKNNIKKVLCEFKKYFDIIIIDGTSCETNKDIISISSLVDSILLVSAFQSTKKEVLLRTIRRLQIAGGYILGVIINKMPQINKDEYKK